MAVRELHAHQVWQGSDRAARRGRPALAAPAGAQAYSTVTMLSEPGDYIGGGVDRQYHPGNGAVGISGTLASVEVSVSGGNRGSSFRLSFAAAPGELLEAGRT